MWALDSLHIILILLYSHHLSALVLTKPLFFSVPILSLYSLLWHEGHTSTNARLCHIPSCLKTAIYLPVSAKDAALLVGLFSCQISCCCATLSSHISQLSEMIREDTKIPFDKDSPLSSSTTSELQTLFGILLPVFLAPSFLH